MSTQTELAIGQNVGSGLMPEVINGKVDARAVHEALGVRSDFPTWIKHRIEEFGFQEGEDFSREFGRNHGARIDYSITLDMAKELAMVERNEMGRKMRRYFIECEKQLHQASKHLAAPGTPAGLSKLETALVDLAREHDARIGELEGKIAAGPDWLAIVTYLFREWDLHLDGGKLSYLTRRCMEETARRRTPVGEECYYPAGGTKKRRSTFSPVILHTVVRPIIERWVKQGRIHLPNGGWIAGQQPDDLQDNRVFDAAFPEEGGQA